MLNAVQAVVTVLMFAAIAVNLYSIIRIRRASRVVADAIAEQQRRTLMPTIAIDDEQRIVGISFEPFDLDAGESLDLAIPRIPGLGQGVLMLDADGGVSGRWLVDYELGTISPMPDEAPMPLYMRDAWG